MVRDARLWALALICALAGLAFTAAAWASEWPPAEGDWIIEAGEDWTHSGQDFNLPGDLIVYGHLTLDSCTLRFTLTTYADTGLSVLDSGHVDTTNGTFVTATNNEFAHVTASGSGVSHFTDCDFNGVVCLQRL